MSKSVESYDELNMKIIHIKHSSNSNEVAEVMKIVVEINEKKSLLLPK
jgi:hypothetical protein